EIGAAPTARSAARRAARIIAAWALSLAVVGAAGREVACTAGDAAPAASTVTGRLAPASDGRMPSAETTSPNPRFRPGRTVTVGLRRLARIDGFSLLLGLRAGRRRGS